MTNETSGIIEHNSCRVCGKKDLEPILYLGDQYVVNFVDSSDQKTNKVPLHLDLCNKKDGGCGLLQLRHTVPGDLLYRNFWYKSGVNQTMRNALMDISSKAEKIVNLNEGDIVVDIGANDGTLLRSYKSKGLRLVGFEPAKNLVKDAELGTTKIINDFFNFESLLPFLILRFKLEVDLDSHSIYKLHDKCLFIYELVNILFNFNVRFNYLNISNST